MRLFISSLLVFLLSSGFCQPQIDTIFRVEVGPPLFLEKAGPVVLVDEAHNNIHTKGCLESQFQISFTCVSDTEW